MCINQVIWSRSGEPFPYASFGLMDGKKKRLALKEKRCMFLELRTLVCLYSLYFWCYRRRVYSLDQYMDFLSLLEGDLMRWCFLMQIVFVLPCTILILFQNNIWPHEKIKVTRRLNWITLKMDGLWCLSVLLWYGCLFFLFMQICNSFCLS